MIELPYLEVCAEVLERKFKNRALQRLEIQHERYTNVSLDALIESLVGNDLKKVWRKGLSLYFQFRNNAVLQMCLSDTAELLVIVGNQQAAAGLLDFYFGGGQMLLVKDAQLLSKFHLNPVYPVVPDVLGKEMTVAYLRKVFSDSTKEVKYVLIDQDILRGIEEIYADEILWYAGISPFSIAGKIPLDIIKVLHRTMKYVLLDAIKQARKVGIWNFKEAKPDLLMIHNEAKKKSPTGGKIKMKVMADSRTYYTDEQYLYM